MIAPPILTQLVTQQPHATASTTPVIASKRIKGRSEGLLEVFERKESVVRIGRSGRLAWRCHEAARVEVIVVIQRWIIVARRCRHQRLNNEWKLRNGLRELTNR
jgi:hypothetical protein